MVRFAVHADLEQVNVLRKQVNDLHIAGRPDIFKPGFPQEMADHAAEYMQREDTALVVCEREGKIRGFAMLKHVQRPENLYRKPVCYLDVDEFGVDAACHRQGVGSELMDWIKAYARENGYSRVELNMWSFNEGALAFYEHEGFGTYRRYMECFLEQE